MSTPGSIVEKWQPLCPKRRSEHVLIRPPVVRQMRRNLFAQMTATPSDFVPEEAYLKEATPAKDDRLSRLQQLGELRDSGVLTEDEFQREKSRILD